MLIYIRTLFGRCYELDVQYTDSIKSIKDKIYEITHIPHSLQVLIFAGRVLKESSLFWDNNLAKESTIHMVYCTGYMFLSKVIITHNDKVFEMKVRVAYSSLIEDIKFQIQDKIGVPCELIKLYYNGKELNDYDVLIDKIYHFYTFMW